MNLSNSVLQVFMILSSQSNENYIVGGAVRDFLLNEDSKDIDIVTDIDIDTVIKLFENNGWNVNTSGKNFLVINISKEYPVVKYDQFGIQYTDVEGIEYEIAQFRSDVEFNDTRYCQVEPSDIFEDAKRRDLTINALYYNPLTGEIKDPNGTGIDDVNNRVLRFVGDPKARIEEDYVRLWRAMRFTKKGFKPTKQTSKLLRTMFNKAYEQSNPSRVLAELIKMEIL